MKNVFILAIFLVIGTALSAQTESGNWLISGSSNLDFSIGKTDNDQEDSETDILLNAKAGMFFADGLAGGLMVGYTSTGTGNDDTFSTFMVGPFVRYYLENGVFGEASYGIGGSSFDGESQGSSGDLGIGVGYAIFLGDNVAIEPLANFHATSFKPEGADDSVSGSNFGLDLGISVFLD